MDLPFSGLDVVVFPLAFLPLCGTFESTIAIYRALLTQVYATDLPIGRIYGGGRAFWAMDTVVRRSEGIEVDTSDHHLTCSAQLSSLQSA